DKVFFRRDPRDPDQVIRVVADLGATDNRWVEVKSGVRQGDEIVLGGVYPLMLASSTTGEMQKGGHFCGADGTFHEGGEH
ncbi:MAG: efflux RND transporter periplasmic adaptor subunit, partial [Phycisphaerae bacterium]|nr:efflux RND transporter periplasmic adaptor subunit [Phycisphaerae bacterium]